MNKQELKQLIEQTMLEIANGNLTPTEITSKAISLISMQRALIKLLEKEIAHENKAA